MEIAQWAGLASVGSFILGVVLAVAALRRRDKEELRAIRRHADDAGQQALERAKAFTREELKDHWREEHQRDSENRTVRERTGLLELRITGLEQRCRERHGGGPR